MDTIHDFYIKKILFNRYARAERELKQARAYGEGATKFYSVAEIEPPKENAKELLVAVTSDRGIEIIFFTKKLNDRSIVINENSNS